MFRLVGFLCIFSVANSSATEVEELAQRMETDVPGSVAAFVEWGEEESKIDYLRDLIDGAQPVPPGFRPLTMTDIANLIIYLYHPQTLEDIAIVFARAVSRGLLVSQLTPPEAAGSLVRFWKNLTTLPPSILSMIWLGQTPEMIFQAVGTSAELKLSSVSRVTTIVSIWRTFCIKHLNSPRLITSEPPCYFDPTQQLWVLGKNASASIARTGLLSSIRKREAAAPRIP